MSATQRITVQIGGRGVAVVEAGAEIDWTVSKRAASVSQRIGNVFYRVDRGDPFVVSTPFGEVQVTGTCFRVEVETMNVNRKAALFGAGALAGGIVVSVYEGKVALRNAEGRAHVGAGERATVGRSGAPEIESQTDAEAETRARQQALWAMFNAGAKNRTAESAPPRQVDVPEPAGAGATLAQERDFYVEATGDTKSASVLSQRELNGRLVRKVGLRGLAVGRRQVSRELAGLVPPPADPEKTPLAERIFRKAITWGDEFERDLARDLGPDRARELAAWAAHGQSLGESGLS